LPNTVCDQIIRDPLLNETLFENCQILQCQGDIRHDVIIYGGPHYPTYFYRTSSFSHSDNRCFVLHLQQRTDLWWHGITHASDALHHASFQNLTDPAGIRPPDSQMFLVAISSEVHDSTAPPLAFSNKLFATSNHTSLRRREWLCAVPRVLYGV
jgi:hypothetical protein